jgi:hypothetical protein
MPLNMVSYQIGSSLLKEQLRNISNIISKLIITQLLSQLYKQGWKFGLFDNMEDEERRNEEPKGEATFGFHIIYLAPNVAMKNIPPSILPNF